MSRRRESRAGVSAFAKATAGSPKVACSDEVLAKSRLKLSASPAVCTARTSAVV